MPSQSTRKSTTPLQRGLACLCCRKRKLKCDGTRPVCHQCTKMNRPEECEYEDRKQKSRTQKLREKLSMLENRVRELESNPAAAAGSSSSFLDSSSESSLAAQNMFEGFDFLGNLDFSGNPVAGPSWRSPASSSSSSSSYQSGASTNPLINGDDFDATYGEIGIFDITAFSGLSSVTYPYMPKWNPNEPLPYETKKFLLDVFMLHRHQCWFDVDMARFDMSTPLLPGTEPHPSLMNAIYLLGCRFSRTPYCTELESVFLTRSLHEITVALDKSDRLLDIVQASCLLAVYYFISNRALEGYTHSFSAARLAVGLGLHQIYVDSLSGMQVPAVTSIPLDPPRDHVELRDRISMFWQVFMVDRCWSTTNGLPVAIPDVTCPQACIRTSWPALSLGFGNAYDALDIMNLCQVNGGKEMYLPALRAKAVALFERTSRLASDSTKSETYWIDCNQMKLALDNFSSSMPVFIGYEAWRTQAPYIEVELFTVHTMIYVSILQLEPESMDFTAQQATNSLMSLIRQISDRDYEFLDPILASCWSILARRLIHALDMATKGEYPIPWEAYTVNIAEQELQLVLNALTGLGSFFPVAGEHARKIMEERSNIVFFPR